MANAILHGAAACAILAPSTHNTQPWRLRISGDRLELSYDVGRRLPRIDPERRQLITSCGCALYNARVAIRASGFLPVVETFPDPDRPSRVATIRLGLPRAPTDHDRATLSAIARRHTNRRPFLDRPVPPSTVDDLARAARAERATFVRLSPAQKGRLGVLVADADRLQLGDEGYKAELARWLRPLASLRKDGIPFAEKEYGHDVVFGVERHLRDAELGVKFGELERQRIDGAPLVAILATEADEPIDWLDCGQALQALLLRVTCHGLAASFLNQVLEVPALAHDVDRLLEREAVAQMIVRIGWAPPVDVRAPRRPLAEVLVED